MLFGCMDEVCAAASTVRMYETFAYMKAHAPDLINGTFEGIGAAMIMLNIQRTRRDKEIKGFRWEPTTFFTVWGLWNLYFYPAMNAWFSFAGGAVLVSLQVVWLIQIWWYLKWPGGRPIDWNKKPRYVSALCKHGNFHDYCPECDH